MKHFFFFLSLCLTACVYHKTPAIKAVSPDSGITTAPVKHSAQSPQIFSKALGKPVDIPLEDLDNFLQQKYHLQNSFEKKMASKMTEMEKVLGGKLLKSVDLQNKLYTIHYEYFSGSEEPDAVKLIVNGRRINRWLWETSDKNIAVSDLTLDAVYTFRYNHADYLVITGNNLQGIGKLSQITFGLLINFSDSSPVAKILTTYSNPGRFFFNPDAVTGNLKYLIAYPLYKDGEGLAGHLSLQVSELVAP